MLTMHTLPSCDNLTRTQITQVDDDSEHTYKLCLSLLMDTGEEQTLNRIIAPASTTPHYSVQASPEQATVNTIHAPQLQQSHCWLDTKQQRKAPPLH